MKKIGNIVRYSIGILFIIGMFGIASDSVLAGIFMGLFGVSLLPVVYDNFIYSNLKLDKRSYLHNLNTLYTHAIHQIYVHAHTNESNLCAARSRIR